MIRALDGRARAYLSDSYRRIDNYEIAETVLPIIGDIKDARIGSCEVTDQRMYIKVVNPRSLLVYEPYSDIRGQCYRFKYKENPI